MIPDLSLGAWAAVAFTAILWILGGWAFWADLLRAVKGKRKGR